MSIVDLTHPLATGMPVHPGDPEVRIEQALSLDVDGAAVSRIGLGSHSGTHLDAPSHTVAGGRTVDLIPLDLLHGEARVLRAAVGAGHRIEAADITCGIPDRLPSIVCVATGWDRHFGAPEAPRHPYLSLPLARELWERGARVLGVDAPSPDPGEDPATAGATGSTGSTGSTGAPLPVHDFWLGRDGIIVENLAALSELPDTVEILILPLRLAGADGSPVRAVARIP